MRIKPLTERERIFAFYERVIECEEVAKECLEVIPYENDEPVITYVEMYIADCTKNGIQNAFKRAMCDMFIPNEKTKKDGVLALCSVEMNYNRQMFIVGLNYK